MILQAAGDHDIDLKRSFMVGDKAHDIILGQDVGCRTVLVPSDPADNESESCSPDYIAADLYEAASWIIEQK